uniref:Uncharacterized protein n=1 Tax=Sinocyclocheilus grahami TaxID=75366 RepID=A0A672LQT8_SINGR
MAAVKACNILISGANRGLGLETVKQLSEDSSQKRHIFATCRDPDGPKSEALRELVKKHPSVITIIRLDADDPSTSLRALKQFYTQCQYSKVFIFNVNVIVGIPGMMPAMCTQFPVLPYCVSKVGFNMLTVLAAEELKADEILCIALHPGWVKTELGGEKVSVDPLNSCYVKCSRCFRFLHNFFQIYFF